MNSSVLNRSFIEKGGERKKERGVHEMRLVNCLNYSKGKELSGCKHNVLHARKENIFSSMTVDQEICCTRVG